MASADHADSSAVAQVLHTIGVEDRGRLLAGLATRFHNLDLAEDVLQEAMVRALETWTRRGVPQNPQAWLMTAAKNRALDIIRSDAVKARRLAALRIESEVDEGDHRAHSADLDEELSTANIPDERLGLFFTCSHPTLKEREKIALILRFLAGLSTAEVAAVFLVDTTTMQQRIVRAKKRITTTGIPFGRPTADQLRERLPGVLRVVYLIFTQGFVPTTGTTHSRTDLQQEAITLARLLVRLLPQETEARGLLSLLLLTGSRAGARTDPAGLPVPLAEQDRGLWDSRLIAEGLSLAQTAAGEPEAGPYTVQATIAALHAEAVTCSETDWNQILVLYGILSRLEPGPVVALNRAVAVGKAKGPEDGLNALEELAADPGLADYRPFHIAHALTLREVGKPEQAERAFRSALDCPGNDAESDYIEVQIRDLLA
ncbi:RNA polymerase, sigma subunit, ECF family [Brevibacterium aurantiacum]|uniref:RNA polymerase, sigma subunit, ECF family n=1 Tax=Brevibacterium aurantiacum TaxID=273384 RepID=A0A2H1J6M4_BREAU|nr:sigma-70 family RNA polymerase sigma factor [Brevibacterium aurantiacum]SMX83116.1 RNA polymerase, sigma subunit, ECF family [Brevibacterium aurantiacum]